VVDLTGTALEALRLYGPVALFLFTFLETSLLFPLLPSEVVVPAAAALLVVDPASLAVFVLAATAGGTLGAYLPFVLFYDPPFGPGERLRERIDVPEERVERGRAWFRRWGQSSVLWGRFLPVVRSVISVPAGLARMDPVRFGAYTAVGSAGFYAATGGLVYYGRRESLFAAAATVAADRPIPVAVAALALVAAGLLARHRSAGR
jgi:membrane protein DedA with SNARE-associated domain